MTPDFDTFYRHDYGNVYRTVRLVIGDPDRAEDVTQEAFARALKRWSKVREMSNPAGWAVVVAINADRKRWQRESRTVVDVVGVSEIQDHASSVVALLAIREALERLTTRQRAAVVLRYLTDLPYSEIAMALGCAEATAKATLHQALAVLRTELTEVDDHEDG